MLEESNYKCETLDNKLKDVIHEKVQLEGEIKNINLHLDSIQSKIEDKNGQIATKQKHINECESALIEANTQLKELQDQLSKTKKKNSGDSGNMKDKLRERESEIDVLKEMIRGTKLQLKSKDTDIQRLQIKIKRLEKTNDIRENMINQIATNIRNGKEIDISTLAMSRGDENTSSKMTL